MKTRANALAAAVPLGVLAIALLADVLFYSLGLYSGAHTGILPVLVAGLLLGLLPLLIRLVAGCRSIVLHPSGLVVFGALAALWLAGGHPMGLFVKTVAEGGLRGIVVDVQLPLALLAAVALGLSFCVEEDHKPFSWRREALWLLALVGAIVVAAVLSMLLESMKPLYLSLAAFLVKLCGLAAAGIVVSCVLPATVLRRAVAVVLMVVSGLLTALLLFYGIRFAVNVVQIVQTHAGGIPSIGPLGALFQWGILLFYGSTTPTRGLLWFATANLLTALSPMLLVWSLRSLLHRDQAAPVAKSI